MPAATHAATDTTAYAKPRSATKGMRMVVMLVLVAGVNAALVRPAVAPTTHCAPRRFYPCAMQQSPNPSPPEAGEVFEKFVSGLMQAAEVTSEWVGKLSDELSEASAAEKAAPGPSTVPVGSSPVGMAGRAGELSQVDQTAALVTKGGAAELQAEFCTFLAPKEGVNYKTNPEGEISKETRPGSLSHTHNRSLSLAHTDALSHTRSLTHTHARAHPLSLTRSRTHHPSTRHIPPAIAVRLTLAPLCAPLRSLRLSGGPGQARR